MIKKLQLAAVAVVMSVGAVAQINVMPPNGDVGIGTTSPQAKLHIRNEADGALDGWSGLRFIPANSSASGYDSYHKFLGFRKNGLWIAGSANGGGGEGARFVYSNMWFKDDGIRFGFSHGLDNPETYPSIFVTNSSPKSPWVFDQSGNDPCFHSEDWWGIIGLKNKRIFQIYTYFIDATDIWTREAHITSDERKKENIQAMSGSLQRICQVKGYTYDLKADFNSTITEKTINKSPKMVQNESVDTLAASKDSIIASRKAAATNHLKNKKGFIAQELQKTFPELVSYYEERGYYTVDYIGMIPVLLESIKEQQAQIAAQQAQIEKLTKTVEKLKK